MKTIFKIAGLSAVLAAGLVFALESKGGERVLGSTKTYEDRIAADAPADRPAPAASVRVADASGATYGPEVARDRKADPATASRCAAQAWPAVTADCMAASGDRVPPRQVRVISLETRPGANVSLVAKAAR